MHAKPDLEKYVRERLETWWSSHPPYFPLYTETKTMEFSSALIFESLPGTVTTMDFLLCKYCTLFIQDSLSYATD